MSSPADWVDKREWVRAYTRCSPDQTYAIGRVYSYCDAPTIGMETADGRRIHWRADLCEPAVQPDEPLYNRGGFIAGAVTVNLSHCKVLAYHPDDDPVAVLSAALADKTTEWIIPRALIEACGPDLTSRIHRDYEDGEPV